MFLNYYTLFNFSLITFINEEKTCLPLYSKHQILKILIHLHTTPSLSSSDFSFGEVSVYLRRLHFLSDISFSVSGYNGVDKAKSLRLQRDWRRLKCTSRYFKRLESIGFWGQFVSTIVAAVILSFSIVVTRKPTSLATFYATASGIVAALISVFLVIWVYSALREASSNFH